MSLFKNDTIVALATAPLAAGIGVIRISGKEALTSIQKMFEKPLEKTRYMYYGTLKTVDGIDIDEVMVVYFKGPNSFTGEDVIEINCHGGLAVIDKILCEIKSLKNVRGAEAGEFTRRAFMNDKLDLTAAEGIADLVEAETEEQRRQALSHVRGELEVRFESWRKDILYLLAHTEAAIDFPDEELDVLKEAGVQVKIQNILNNLESAIATNVGERLREGFNVAILGKPNAGKSSLTNLLTGKETAIVSDIAGTTRDVIDSHLNVDGYPIIISDTAGIRDTDDVIEKEGVIRAKAKAKGADISVLVIDPSNFSSEDVQLLSLLQENRAFIVFSKKDTFNNLVEYTKFNYKVDLDIKNQMVKFNDIDIPYIHANLTDMDSLPPIMEILSKRIQSLFSQSQRGARISRERHRQSILQACEHLKRGVMLFEQTHAVSVSELLAQDLRDAAQSIGQVTGKTDTEDVLDLVFSTFCVGK
jgi:tRNA modification GTPase